MIRIEIEKKDGGESTVMMNVKNENVEDIIFELFYGVVMALEKIPGVNLEQAEERKMLAGAFRMMLEPEEPEDNEENA